MYRKNIRNVKFVIVFFQALNAPKIVFSWGSASNSAEGAYDAPPGLLFGSPYPFPVPSTPSSRSRRLDFWAPPNKFLATPMASC